jgi:hypothetical protein
MYSDGPSRWGTEAGVHAVRQVRQPSPGTNNVGGAQGTMSSLFGGGALNAQRFRSRVQSFWVTLATVVLTGIFAHAIVTRSVPVRYLSDTIVGHLQVSASSGNLPRLDLPSPGSFVEGVLGADRRMNREQPRTYSSTRAPVQVPEPASLLLMGAGLFSIAALIRSRYR